VTHSLITDDVTFEKHYEREYQIYGVCIDARGCFDSPRPITVLLRGVSGTECLASDALHIESVARSVESLQCCATRGRVIVTRVSRSGVGFVCNHFALPHQSNRKLGLC
jgi:hypothetical protein